MYSLGRRSKKPAVKRKSTKKTTKLPGRSLLSRKPVMFMLAFAAIAGGVLLYYSMAATKGTPVIAEKATNLGALETSIDSNGKVTYVNQPIDARLYSTGKLLCGTRTTLSATTLSAAQMTTLENELEKNGVKNLDKIFNKPAIKDPRLTSQTIRYKVNGTKIRSTLYTGSVPNDFLNVSMVLAKACNGVATPAKDIPETQVSVRPHLPNMLASVKSFFMPIVHAAGIDGNGEAIQYNDINNVRAQNGRGRLGYSSCISGYARAWAQQMGASNTLSHNPNLAGQMNNCYRWRNAGENVGVGGSSQQIFDAFMQSEHHRDNILDPAFSTVGIGAYVGNDGRYWIAHEFVGCAGCNGDGSMGGGTYNPPPPPPPPTSTIQGYNVNMQSQAIGGAVITHKDPAPIISNGSNPYSLGGLPQGWNRVHADAPPYYRLYSAIDQGSERRVGDDGDVVVNTSGSPSYNLWWKFAPWSDLYMVLKNGGSGRTEVHALSGTSNYQGYNVHSATALGPTTNDPNAIFLMGNFDGDSKPDLYLIKRNGGCNKTEIHILSGASNYQSWIMHACSGLEATTNNDNFAFAVGDLDQDGKDDVYAIKKNGGCGNTEVHVMSASSNFSSFSMHSCSALVPTTNDPNYVFTAGDFDRDGKDDVYAIKKNGGCGNTEVHVMSASSNFTQWADHSCSGLAATTNDPNWAFGVGKTGDLYIIKANGGSGRTEVHALSRNDNFQSFFIHTATAQSQTTGINWNNSVSR